MDIKCQNCGRTISGVRGKVKISTSGVGKDFEVSIDEILEPLWGDCQNPDCRTRGMYLLPATAADLLDELLNRPTVYSE